MFYQYKIVKKNKLTFHLKYFDENVEIGHENVLDGNKG
jgi:hypothetical protein